MIAKLVETHEEMPPFLIHLLLHLLRVLSLLFLSSSKITCENLTLKRNFPGDHEAIGHHP